MLGAEVLIGLASLMCTRNDPRADLSLIGLDIGLLFGLLFGVLFLLNDCRSSGGIAGGLVDDEFTGCGEDDDSLAGEEPLLTRLISLP